MALRSGRLTPLQADTLAAFVRRAPGFFLTGGAVLVGIPTDAPEEIVDLVDLLALERRGYRVEEHLDAAKTKDAGVSPATLAWLLSSIHAPEKIEGAEREELEAFIRDLERRMLLLSTP